MGFDLSIQPSLDFPFFLKIDEGIPNLSENFKVNGFKKDGLQTSFFFVLQILVVDRHYKLM